MPKAENCRLNASKQGFTGHALNLHHSTPETHERALITFAISFPVCSSAGAPPPLAWLGVHAVHWERTEAVCESFWA